MQIRWYGQSSFLLRGEHSVFIDPFGSMEAAAARGSAVRLSADRRSRGGAPARHARARRSQNAVEVVGGSPQVIRSTAGTFESPLGEVVGIASEHDDVAGTKRGPNTIFRFVLDGLRVSHFGDFGQAELRAAQQQAIGEVDVLFLPVGGGPTVGGEPAAAIVRALRPRLVVPMHYGTDAVDFLDPPDAFLDALGARVERLDESELDAERYLGTAEGPNRHTVGSSCLTTRSRT